MRISDWSSDVCSSDLNIGAIVRAGIENREMVSVIGINIEKVFTLTFGLGAWLAGIAGGLAAPIMGVTPAMGFDILPIAFRSEARRGGKECVSTCRSRWTPDHYTTKQRPNTVAR